MAADILNYFIPIIILGLIAGFFLLVLFSIKRLFKIHLEIRLILGRALDNRIKAIPDSGNLS